MSQDRHSFIAFYPSDWLGGTARMTRLHRSVYFDVCLYIWDKAEPCPATELPLMLGDIANWRDLIEDLLAAGKLVRSADGSLVNEKALAEGRKAYELWLKKSNGGKDGAEKTNRRKEKTGTPVKSGVGIAGETDDGTPVKSGPGVPPQNQNQNQNKTSEDKSSGAVAPNVSRETKQADLLPLPEAPKPAEPIIEDIPLSLVRVDNGDYAKALFRNGLAFVAEQLGKPPAACRALMGKWRQLCGDDDRRLFTILLEAQRDGRADLPSWVPKAIAAGAGMGLPAAQSSGGLSATALDIIARQKAERGAA